MSQEWPKGDLVSLADSDVRVVPDVGVVLALKPIFGDRVVEWLLTFSGAHTLGLALTEAGVPEDDAERAVVQAALDALPDEEANP